MLLARQVKSLSFVTRKASVRFVNTTDGEKLIQKVLMDSLSPTEVKVADISGGCGDMYDVYVESKLFQGKSLVSQHRMVTKALEKEIKAMHGLRISTKSC